MRQVVQHGWRRYGARRAAALLCALPLLAGCHGAPADSALPGPGKNPIPASPNTAPNPAVASWQPTTRLFDRGMNTPAKVALTFDAGADPDAVPLILQTLAEHHVHATFFLTGKFCELFPDQCRAIADAGMELGNHSFSHPHFTKETDEEIRSQLERAEAAIVKACGRGAKPLFRFPYGDSDRRTRDLVAALGYQPIHWTLDSLDSVGKPKSADFVAARILGKIKPGYITLMHVSRVESAKALPRIFDYLDKTGVQVVPVSELLLNQP
jgi:peptidoglycan/xylan/chitin deacetylase (PgdA/CDA1 family)